MSATRSWLLYPGCHILADKFWRPDPSYQNLATRSSVRPSVRLSVRLSRRCRPSSVRPSPSCPSRRLRRPLSVRPSRPSHPLSVRPVVLIPRGARQKTLNKALDKDGIMGQWDASSWAKKIKAKEARKAMTDNHPPRSVNGAPQSSLYMNKS